jgi:hypothetical protein
MSNLYRGPSKDDSFQVSIHLQSGFRGEDFLEINQSEGGSVLSFFKAE